MFFISLKILLGLFSRTNPSLRLVGDYVFCMGALKMKKKDLNRGREMLRTAYRVSIISRNILELEMNNSYSYKVDKPSERRYHDINLQHKALIV